jgi:hypothetical protein
MTGSTTIHGDGMKALIRIEKKDQERGEFGFEAVTERGLQV